MAPSAQAVFAQAPVYVQPPGGISQPPLATPNQGYVPPPIPRNPPVGYPRPVPQPVQGQGHVPPPPPQKATISNLPGQPSASKAATKKKNLSNLISQLVGGSLFDSNSKDDLAREVSNPYILSFDFSTKSGRDCFEVGSKGCSKPYNLLQKGFACFCMQVERASNEFHWGEAVYRILTSTEYTFMIRSPRGATLQEVKDEATRIWGLHNTIIPSRNNDVVNSRKQCTMIAHWIIKSLTDDGLRKLTPRYTEYEQ